MSIPVYVSYEPDGSPKAPVSVRDRNLQFMVSRLQKGGDLRRDVYKLIRSELKGPIEDYILFWPHHKVWLSPEKQLGLIKIDAGAKLVFRPKKRCLKIRFLDGSSKLILVDETKPIKGVVEDLSAQLRLDHPEELSLVVAGDYAVQKHHPAKTMVRVGSGSPVGSRRSRKENKAAPSTIKEGQFKDSPPPLSPSIRRRRPSSGHGSVKVSSWSASKVKKQISKKHQIRLDTPWLDPNRTLLEQEVTESDELILVYRFYYHMSLDRGTPNVEMLYKQARATYLAGELLCSPNDMVRLSAILCQITKGDYSSHKYSPDFLLAIKNLIAPPKCKVKTIAKQIMAEHISLKGLSVTDAKCWFVKLWSSLELFGMEFYSCTNMDTKDKSLLGVSRDRIMFLFHKKKKNLSWDIDTLVQWNPEPKKDIVALTFSHDGSTEQLNLHLPDYSGVLVDCLQGHRDLSDSVPDIARTCSGYQFDEELESAISDFAAQTKIDAKERRALNSLTYEDVYWASKIENPLLSDEELAQLQSSSWENPVFENMDQLMDERFNFLDFSEYGSENAKSSSLLASQKTAQFLDRSSPETSPTHSPHIIQKQLKTSPDLTSKSPLLTTHRIQKEMGERGELHSSSTGALLRPGGVRLSNGLKSHSRSASSGSSCLSEGDKDSGVVTSASVLSTGRSASPSIFVTEIGRGKNAGTDQKSPASVAI